MKEYYMIVRITEYCWLNTVVSDILSANQLAEDIRYSTMKPCYYVVDKDFETIESAVNQKNKLNNPHHYIVVPYYI